MYLSLANALQKHAKQAFSLIIVQLHIIFVKILDETVTSLLIR